MTKQPIERVPTTRCPAVGRVVRVYDEAHHGLSCLHCEYLKRITQRSIHCHYNGNPFGNAIPNPFGNAIPKRRQPK